jgi:hypothetical protein
MRKSSREKLRPARIDRDDLILFFISKRLTGHKGSL